MSSLLARIYSQTQLAYVPHTSVSGETWSLVGRGTTSGAGAADGTTLVDASGVANSSGADAYNGRWWIRILSGTNQGAWKRITDDDGAGSLTLENNGFDNQIAASVEYELWLSPEPVVLVDSSSGETNAVDAVRSEADDFWNDYYLVPITGNRRGRIAKITDFVSATGTFTLAASSGGLGLGGALAAGDVCLIRRFVDFSGLNYGLTEGYERRPGNRVNFAQGDGVILPRGGSFGFTTQIRGSGEQPANGSKPSKPETYGLWQGCGYTVVTNNSDLVNDAGAANTTTAITVDDASEFDIGAMILHDGNPTIVQSKSGEVLTVEPALPSIPADDDTIYGTHNFRKTVDGDVYGVVLECEIDGVRTTMTGCKGNVMLTEGEPPTLQWTYNVDHWVREIEAAPYRAADAYSTVAPCLEKDRKVWLSGTATNIGGLTASLNAEVQPKNVQGSAGINGRAGYQVSNVMAAGGTFRELLDASSATMPQELRWTARTAKELFAAYGSHGQCFALDVPVARLVQPPTPTDADGMVGAPQVFEAQDAGVGSDPDDGLVKVPDFQFSLS